jgi:8-oxo-dGTP pyrophosphatase MutT (NUDIX family)
VSAPRIVPLRGIEATYDSRDWPWARANADAIAAHWAEMVAARPSLFNGRVLIAGDERVESGIYRASFFPVDYAAFSYWLRQRDERHGDENVSNTFAMAALRTADGAFLVGEMGAQTANARQLYFPAGTPDMSDVTQDGRIDLAGSVLRELTEETGLTPDDVVATSNWCMVTDAPRTALMREVRIDAPAEAVAGRIRDWLARQERPELADVHIVRGPGDIDEARMPRFMQAYLAGAFKNL